MKNNKELTIDQIIDKASNLEEEAYYLQCEADKLLTELIGKRLNREQKEQLKQMNSIVAYDLTES